MASKPFHVMMFPWLAFGHLLPFLELSKRLAEKGMRISFVSTPKNIHRLPPIPPKLEQNLKMDEVPLPKVEGLPENCEATIDLQLDQIPYLKKAYDQLRIPLEGLLRDDLPDFILFDFAAGWIPELASKFGVRSAFFSVYAAATLAYLGPPDELKSGSKRTRPEDFTVAPVWFGFPSLVALMPHDAPILFEHLYFPDQSGISSVQRMAKAVEGSEFVAIRSCREFAGEYLELLEELYQKPIIPVGLLPPNLPANRTGNDEWLATFKWLNKQKPKSVVFVGFGSEYKMPIEQIHELGLGLELSNLPFIWILRKPEEIIDGSNLLPDGFLNRTSDRGLVSVGWAPQVEILAHQAIGGCLFHSGWGSIIESLGFGHPQILMPMVADQGLNAKLLVEKQVGCEVPRNEDGSFTRDGVAMSMRLVMVEQEGEEVRSKAAEMRAVFGDRDLHDQYINKLITYLSSIKERSS